MSHLFCIIEKREQILEKIEQAVEYVGLNCSFCNVCWHRHVVRELQKEAGRVGLRTFNSDLSYWSIDWYKNKEGEYMPKLVYYN